MLLAYVDESGNLGAPSVGGTHMYTLGCVFLRAEEWPEAFEGALDLRRNLRDAYGLPIRAEVKANFLIRGTGPFRNLGLAPAVRHLVYRAHMRHLQRMPSVRAFAIAVDKRGRTPERCAKCFDLAWEALLQRLERSTRDNQEPFMIIHDEGADAAVRRWSRRSRRMLTAGSAFGPGSMGNHPAKRLVDDPVPRQSESSYFIQLADLVAYAAFRYEIPPSPPIAAVCPQGMWNEMGPAIFSAATGLIARSAPGIVLRPC